MVGQVTNQLGLALWRNTVAPFKSDFTVGVYVNGFRTGSYSSTSPLLNHCILASSMIVMADHVVVTPDNVQWGSEPTALQRIASQVPSLILTAVIVSPLFVRLSQTHENITLQWFGTGILQQSSDLKNWSVVRLAKFCGLNRSTLRLHLKECEFRFNHRRDNLYQLLLKNLKNNPLNWS